MSADPDRESACPDRRADTAAPGAAEGPRQEPDEGTRKPPRSVRFPEEDQLVTQYFEPANPWQDVPTTSRAQLAAEYLEYCRRHNTPPIDSVLQQIRELPESCIGGGARAARLCLAGAALGGAAPADALEALLRRVQFRRIDLHHCEIDDEGAEALFDMIEYYESANAVSISGPRQFGIRGWQAACRMIKKSSELSEVSLSESALCASHAPVLVRALRPHTCRLRALCLQRAHLAGEPLLCLVIALKSNASIRELRLPDNQLTVSDAQQLASLLKLNLHIQLLDLSNNDIQDAGTGHLADALVAQAEQTPPSAGNSPLSPLHCIPSAREPRMGLAFLVLWNNQLTRNCAPHLSKALSASQSLCVLNIGRNALGADTVRALQCGGALVCLGLQAARLGPGAARPLADLLKADTKLQRLDLRDNRLGVAGLEAILAAMQDNTTLTQIDLDDPEECRGSWEEGEAAAAARLTRDIAALCRRNEPAAGEPRAVHRKISLTCHTVAQVKTSPLCAQAAPSRSARLRSPAPSPAPSPAGSPIPHTHHHSRFNVTRVTPDRESSSESSPTTPPHAHSPSRFKVVQVAEPPQIQIHPAGAQKRQSRFSVTRNYDAMYNPSASPSPSASPVPTSPLAIGDLTSIIGASTVVGDSTPIIGPSTTVSADSTAVIGASTAVCGDASSPDAGRSTGSPACSEDVTQSSVVTTATPTVTVSSVSCSPPVKTGRFAVVTGSPSLTGLPIVTTGSPTVVISSAPVVTVTPILKAPSVFKTTAPCAGGSSHTLSHPVSLSDSVTSSTTDDPTVIKPVLTSSIMSNVMDSPKTVSSGTVTQDSPSVFDTSCAKPLDASMPPGLYRLFDNPFARAHSPRPESPLVISASAVTTASPTVVTSSVSTKAMVVSETISSESKNVITTVRLPTQEAIIPSTCAHTSTTEAAVCKSGSNVGPSLEKTLPMPRQAAESNTLKDKVVNVSPAIKCVVPSLREIVFSSLAAVPSTSQMHVNIHDATVYEIDNNCASKPSEDIHEIKSRTANEALNVDAECGDVEMIPAVWASVPETSLGVVSGEIIKCTDTVTSIFNTPSDMKLGISSCMAIDSESCGSIDTLCATSDSVSGVSCETLREPENKIDATNEEIENNESVINVTSSLGPNPYTDRSHEVLGPINISQNILEADVTPESGVSTSTVPVKFDVIEQCVSTKDKSVAIGSQFNIVAADMQAGKVSVDTEAMEADILIKIAEIAETVGPKVVDPKNIPYTKEYEEEKCKSDYEYSDIKASDIEESRRGKTYSEVVKRDPKYKDKSEQLTHKEEISDSVVKSETKLIKKSVAVSESEKIDVNVEVTVKKEESVAKVHSDQNKDYVIDDIIIRKEPRTMKQIEAITEDLGNLIQEMKDMSSKSRKVKSDCTVDIVNLETNTVPGNFNRDIVLKKNKSESSLDSPDLEVSRLMNKKLIGSPFCDSSSSLEISGSSMESLNATENMHTTCHVIPKHVVIQESVESDVELDRRKDVALSTGSSIESASDQTPVNSGNLLNMSVSSNESVSPIIFGKKKKIHDSLSSLEASMSSLDSGKQEKVMVTSADSGIEYSLQQPSENKDDNSSNEGTLTHNSSLRESVKKAEQETLTSSPKRTSSLLDVPALKSKGLDRMRKISLAVAPSSSFHVPRPEAEKMEKPSHLEKLLSLFQHPTSLFSRSQSDGEQKSASNTPPRKDSSLTSSFWSWGSAVEKDKDDKEDSSEATDSTLSERVQVSFVDESFSKKLDSKTPSTDTDNTLSEFQSFPTQHIEKVTDTTDEVQKSLDLSVSDKAGANGNNQRASDTTDLNKPNDFNKNYDDNKTDTEICDNMQEVNPTDESKEDTKLEPIKPRSFAAVLKSSGSENSLEKQPSPDTGESVEKLPTKIIRGIKENISPENTLTSSMTNTETLALELTEREVKHEPTAGAVRELPTLDKMELKTEEVKTHSDLAPIATIDETSDEAADNTVNVKLEFIDDVKTDEMGEIVQEIDVDTNKLSEVTTELENVDLGKDALSYLIYESQDFEAGNDQAMASQIESGSLAQELKDAEIKEMLDLSPELILDEDIDAEVFAPKEAKALKSPVVPERAKLKKANSLEDLSQRDEDTKISPKTKTIAFKVPETQPRDIPRPKLRTMSGSSPKSLPESLNKPCPLSKMDSCVRKRKKVSSLGKMAKDSLLALNMSEDEIAEYRRSYATSAESLRSLESVSEDANSQSGTSVDSRCRACLRTSQESLMSLDSITEDCRCAADCDKPGRSAR